MSTTTHKPLAQESSTFENAMGTTQLVGFRLGNEEYGVKITAVREIMLPGEITHIPETPDYIKGLINIRGTVIPVIDLRIRFGLTAEESTDATRTIVLSVRDKMIGVIVDAVTEVLRISHDQVAPPPPTVAGLKRQYLTGLVKLEDRLLILLDIDKVFGQEEAEKLGTAVAETRACEHV